MKLSYDWEDYECIDASSSEKLERWKDIILRRPDPQAMWKSDKKSKMWNDAHAVYLRSPKGGGEWKYNKKFKKEWTIDYKGLTFKVSPTGFKHTGLFPEQAVNWDYIMDSISNANKEVKVLNLFAYTGGATMAASKAGAKEVVHVDASKGMVDWAKENMRLSNLENNKIRFIVDDCLKFVEREKRRKNSYDVIIMDPPSYGRGPNGEIWKFEDSIYNLIYACMDILSDEPLFMLINSYTTGISNTVLENILKTTLLKKYPNYIVEAGEVGLPITKDGLVLPCGIYGLFKKD